MEYRSSEIKAGIFIVFSVMVFIAFLVVIAGMDAWSDKDIYRARFKYVGGIEKGSVVRYAGLEVGRVIDLQVPPDQDTRVEIKLELTRGVPIRTDSKAFLTTIGLMGAYYIEISAGSDDAPPLPPGSLLKSDDVAGFAQMSGSMDAATEEATELLRRINDLLNAENRKNISSMIASLNEMTTTSSGDLQDIAVNLSNLTEQLSATVDSFHRTLVSNDSSISKSFANFQEMLEQSKEMVVKLNGTIDNLNNNLSGNSAAYNEIMRNVTSLTENLDEFSQTIKEQPWSLVRKSYPPERKLP
jgi:phospholipid/cholesterol/gamma-HCH transport system substrate-binding protein